MRFAQTWLWINAVLFMGFGLGFVVAPQALAEMVTGDAPSVASAVIDMRATYGGVAIGAGVFLMLCARRPEWVAAGLMSTLLAFAGLAGARLLGILVDGDPNAFMLAFLAAEVGGTALTWAVLRPGRGSDSSGLNRHG